MLKLPFYYTLSTFNSKMDAENPLLELEAVEVPAVNKTAGSKGKHHFSAQEIAKIYSSKVWRKSSSTEIKVYTERNH